MDVSVVVKPNSPIMFSFQVRLVVEVCNLRFSAPAPAPAGNGLKTPVPDPYIFVRIFISKNWKKGRMIQSKRVIA